MQSSFNLLVAFQVLSICHQLWTQLLKTQNPGSAGYFSIFTFLSILQPLHKFFHLLEENALPLGKVGFSVPLQYGLFTQYIRWKRKQDCEEGGHIKLPPREPETFVKIQRNNLLMLGEFLWTFGGNLRPIKAEAVCKKDNA